MQTGRYPILDILDFPNIDQFVVPEIQRDYVWSELEIRGLLDSIKDGFFNNENPYIGFLYAHTNKDCPYKYFLIDGQQRLTTVFLLLIALYHKINKDFPEHLVKVDKLKLDYKVRQATHDFLYHFIGFLNTVRGKDKFIYEEIYQQIWYHVDYKNDISITNLIQNFILIYDWLTTYDINQLKPLLEFVEKKIQLSYFRVDEERQGEDLYIYMNARGRHLVENETLKAKFLSKIEDAQKKEHWGKIWETWQDFFWVNKQPDDVDSDRGFMDFLRIVQIISMCKKDYSSDEKNGFIIENQGMDFDLLPDLNKIEKYFYAFKYIIENKKISALIDNAYVLNKDKKLVDYFKLLPLINVISSVSILNEDSIYRFSRFFYNIARKDNVYKDIRNQLMSALKLIDAYTENNKENYDICDLIDYRKGKTILLDDEECVKLYLYSNPPQQTNRENLEELFWKMEDHPILNGNISFLLFEYFKDEVIDLDGLIKSWEAFSKLFGNKSNNKNISKALIYYGNTWQRNSPKYYNNYNCQNWAWLVNQEKQKFFLMSLIKDMQGKEFNYIDTIIQEKISDYFNQNCLDNIFKLKQIRSFYEQMKVLVAIDYYSENIIWRNGGYIAEDNFHYWEQDCNFFGKKAIYNVERYIGDGLKGRIFKLLESILENEEKLNEIIEEILNRRI
jgi:uncharacterized protein with ParB-like and HNH nuclease domain